MWLCLWYYSFDGWFLMWQKCLRQDSTQTGQYSSSSVEQLTQGLRCPTWTWELVSPVQMTPCHFPYRPPGERPQLDQSVSVAPCPTHSTGPTQADCTHQERHTKHEYRAHQVVLEDGPVCYLHCGLQTPGETSSFQNRLSVNNIKMQCIQYWPQTTNNTILVIMT